MKKAITLLLATTLCIVGTKAQRWDIGGMILDPNAPTAMDMFNWSNISSNFGTARSMGMAGAMTSLGGDISSIAINPAGLGMYRQNDISVTPMIGVAHSSTGDTERNGSRTNTRFSIANFGVVLKAYEGTGKVVAVNVGFGYNRLADLNYRTSFARTGTESTIAGVFARQLHDSGYTSNDFYDSSDRFDWWRIDPSLWGAALGYKCGVVDDKSGTASWAPDFYGDGFRTGQYATFDSRGSIGEYAFSTGLNIDNKIYVGLTLGIQSLYQRRDVRYDEAYDYGAGSIPAPDRQLEGFNYEQTSIASGTGVNIKAGITYRPTSALRIGLAVHTPTWYTLNYKYQGAMVSRVFDHGTGKYIKPDPDGLTEVWVDSGGDSWHFRTPARLMVGASYTFGTKAIVSVDYERSWYNSIRTPRTPIGKGAYNDFFREQFKGANTLRIGAEYKPTQVIAVRAGYGYNGSMVRDRKTIFSSPVAYRTQYAAAGLGFVLSRYFYIDIAYQYMVQQYTTAKLFYAVDTEGSLDEMSGDYTTRINRHNIALTLGFRF